MFATTFWVASRIPPQQFPCRRFQLVEILAWGREAVFACRAVQLVDASHDEHQPPLAVGSVDRTQLVGECIAWLFGDTQLVAASDGRLVFPEVLRPRPRDDRGAQETRLSRLWGEVEPSGQFGRQTLDRGLELQPLIGRETWLLPRDTDRILLHANGYIRPSKAAERVLFTGPRGFACDDTGTHVLDDRPPPMERELAELYPRPQGATERAMQSPRSSAAPGRSSDGPVSATARPGIRGGIRQSQGLDHLASTWPTAIPPLDPAADNQRHGLAHDAALADTRWPDHPGRAPGTADRLIEDAGDGSHLVDAPDQGRLADSSGAQQPTRG